MDPLIIALPTHDDRVVVQTLLELLKVGNVLGVSAHVFSSEASNIPRARNQVLAQIRQRFPNWENPWVLWVDSDIVVPMNGHQPILEAIRWAQAHRKIVIANYLMANGIPVVMRPDGTHFTLEEIAALPDYSPIGLAGLGFAYLPQPLDYVFHADRVGEDVYLWRDHPEWSLHLAKNVRLGHRKTVLLTEYSLQDN